MKKIILVLSMVFLVFGSAAIAEVKIGVVNMQKALDKCDAGKASIEKIKKEYQAKQIEIDAKSKALQKMQDELNNQSSLLSESAKKEKLAQYQKELKELKRFIQDSNEELKRKEAEAVNKIGKELAEVVRKLGKELKYTIILEEMGAGAIYFSNKVDITDLVVERYNKEWHAKK
jgi:outer membrane protein